MGLMKGRMKPDKEAPEENKIASWNKGQRTKPVAGTLSEEWLWEVG